MELDTGSALTILPGTMFQAHFDLPLQPTSTIMKPYAGDRLRPKGMFRANVCYNGQKFEADTYVVDADGAAFLGVAAYRRLCFSKIDLQSAHCRWRWTMNPKCSSPGN